MARIVLNRKSGMHVVYQLDTGVGVNRPNKRSDVALVQFFLEQTRYRWGPGGAGERTTVSMDGVCGKVTTEAIMEFQAFTNRQFGTMYLKTDGAVDPLRSAPGSSPSSLVELQILFASAQPGLFPFFHKTNSFKGDLVPELFKIQ